MQTNSLPATRSLDYKLAFHCAPVIAGIKPANILSIKKPVPDCFWQELAHIARPLGARGMFFYRLAECDGRILLLLYNKVVLQQHLGQPGNMRILARYGYQYDCTVADAISQLALRFRASCDFPHEIGVFLGYPARDVECFIQHGGRNFQICGYWKVYDDVENAKRIFSVYDRARSYFCQKVSDGEEIYDITYGGTAI